MRAIQSHHNRIIQMFVHDIVSLDQYEWPNAREFDTQSESSSPCCHRNNDRES